MFLFSRCKLTCDPNSVLLPRPRKMRLGPQVTLFRPIDVGYSSHGRLKANYSDDLLNQAIHEQMEYLLLKKVRNAKRRCQFKFEAMSVFHIPQAAKVFFPL